MLCVRNTGLWYCSATLENVKLIFFEMQNCFIFIGLVCPILFDAYFLYCDHLAFFQARLCVSTCSFVPKNVSFLFDICNIKAFKTSPQTCSSITHENSTTANIYMFGTVLPACFLLLEKKENDKCTCCNDQILGSHSWLI